MFKLPVSLFSALIIIFASCNNNPVQQSEPTVLFQQAGLVDSVVVTQCVANSDSYYTDTLQLNSYNKVKVEFDGLTNSDGSFVKIFLNTDTSSTTELYSVENQMNLNGIKSAEFIKPDNKVSFEIRMYINPPVCGQGDYKFTRVRDLKVYGIK